MPFDSMIDNQPYVRCWKPIRIVVSSLEGSSQSCRLPTTANRWSRHERQGSLNIHPCLKNGLSFSLIRITG